MKDGPPETLSALEPTPIAVQAGDGSSQSALKVVDDLYRHRRYLGVMDRGCAFLHRPVIHLHVQSVGTFALSVEFMFRAWLVEVHRTYQSARCRRPESSGYGNDIRHARGRSQDIHRTPDKLLRVPQSIFVKVIIWRGCCPVFVDQSVPGQTHDAKLFPTH